jgi:uncharacterized membrane protein
LQIVYFLLVARTYAVSDMSQTYPLMRGICVGIFSMSLGSKRGNRQGVYFALLNAPVAVVAALRETSILFGTLIAGFLLREHVGMRRILSACKLKLA